MIVRAFVFLLIFLCTPCQAVLQVSADQKLQDPKIGKSLLYLRDPHHSLTSQTILQDINAQPWQLSGQDAPNFGLDDASFWFWFNVKNTAGEHVTWLLEIGYPILDFVDVYLEYDNKNIKHWHSGDQVPSRQRPISHRNFVFPIKLQSQQSAKVLIHIQTSGTMQFPIALSGEINFFQSQQKQSVLQGIFIGLFLVMIIYNLFLYSAIREKSYLYYVIFVSSFLLFFLAVSGYGFQFIWGESLLFQQYSIFIFVAIGLISLVQFTREFLQISKQAAMEYWLLKSATYLGIGNLVLCFFLPYQFMIQVLMLSCIASTLACIVVSISSWPRMGYVAKLYTSRDLRPLPHHPQ